jgi:hypothetical protein
MSHTHDAYPPPTGRISSTTILHICHSEGNRRQSSYKWSNAPFARKVLTFFQVVQELVGDWIAQSKREDKQAKAVESE